MAKNHTGGGREAGFWILLLGSWMMLNSPAWPNQWLGAIGTASFLWLAFGSLGTLRSSGMKYMQWEPAPHLFWLWAVALGFLSAAVAICIALVAGQRVAVAAHWRVFLLQAALGPVLEEVLFRGYLIQLLLSVLRTLRRGTLAAVLLSATIFAGLHVIQPGRGWKEFAVIAGTGTLYGSIRIASSSTAPASLAHAAYNLTVQLGAMVFACII